MSNAQEPEQIAEGDDQYTEAQTKRRRPVALALVGCLIGMSTPFKQYRYLDSVDLHGGSFYAALKPKWRDPDEPLFLMEGDDLHDDANSLLRASEEPLQAQRAILLRAAGETQEWHSEQLLRAVGERE